VAVNAMTSSHRHGIAIELGEWVGQNYMLTINRHRISYTALCLLRTGTRCGLLWTQ